jgi:hypothetical protein
VLAGLLSWHHLNFNNDMHWKSTRQQLLCALQCKLFLVCLAYRFLAPLPNSPERACGMWESKGKGAAIIGVYHPHECFMQFCLGHNHSTRFSHCHLLLVLVGRYALHLLVASLSDGAVGPSALLGRGCFAHCAFALVERAAPAPCVAAEFWQAAKAALMTGLQPLGGSAMLVMG